MWPGHEEQSFSDSSGVQQDLRTTVLKEKAVSLIPKVLMRGTSVLSLCFSSTDAIGFQELTP